MSRPKRTDRSRSFILDAADAAFRERGFANVSMEEIAQRAGLSRKTVYNLYASKEDIVFQLAARLDAQYDPVMRARMTANERAMLLLETALLDGARWCMANPTIARLVLSGPTKPSVDPPSDRPSFHRLIRDLLILGQKQGIIRADKDANLLALVLLGIWAQSMLFSLTTGSFREDAIRRLLALIVDGIGTPSSKTHPKKSKRRA